jgi:hypothetical protein
MDRFQEGLRCQDVTLGLRELHPNDTDIRVLRNTQMVGMAADIAGLVRGRNLITNLDSLEVGLFCRFRGSSPVIV